MSLRTLVRHLRGDALDALATELRVDRATVVQVLRDGLAANGAHPGPPPPPPPPRPSLYAQLGYAGGIARIVDGDPQGIDGLHARIVGSAWRDPDPVLAGCFAPARPRTDQAGRWLAWHLRRAVEDLAKADDPYQLGQLAPGTWPPGMTAEAFGRLGGHLAAVMHELGYPRDVRAELLGRVPNLSAAVVAFADPSDEGGNPEPPAHDDAPAD